MNSNFWIVWTLIFKIEYDPNQCTVIFIIEYDPIQYTIIFRIEYDIVQCTVIFNMQICYKNNQKYEK